MHNFEIKGFENGQWVPLNAPEWFKRATDTDEAWRDAFAFFRVTLVEEMACGDSIQIFRTEDRTHCIVFADANDVILVVFIKSASDYVQFRAEVIAPNVRLMRDAEELDQRERQREQARRLRRIS